MLEEITGSKDNAKQPVPMRLQFSIDVMRFGVPLDVHTPAAGDAVDLDELIGG